jgi:hypothetical protein
VAGICGVVIAQADAEVQCQTDKNGYTYCWDSDSKEQTTCQQSGSYTYCD